MRPPSQTAGRGGLERCINCGFGLGQFGVEFSGDFCSLDCFTSAKVKWENMGMVPPATDVDKARVNRLSIHCSHMRNTALSGVNVLIYRLSRRPLGSGAIYIGE